MTLVGSCGAEGVIGIGAADVSNGLEAVRCFAPYRSLNSRFDVQNHRRRADLSRSVRWIAGLATSDIARKTSYFANEQVCVDYSKARFFEGNINVNSFARLFIDCV